MSRLSTTSTSLQSTVKQLKKSQYGKLGERAQIISSELCDDVLRRLAPSLKPYIGCDIVDINPGVCLWSSKLHEYLQPRRHVLVEPHADLYKPWIQPLVDDPGTRYCLAPFSRADYVWNYQTYLDMGLLPNHEEEAAASQSSNGKRKLLILANASRHIRGSNKSGTPGKKLESQQVAFEYVSTMEHKSGFHSNGVARMLMWMLDEEKSHILPRTTHLRRRFAATCDRSCHVEEITGGATLSTQREVNIEFESCIATAQRMSRNGISIPSSRLDKMPRRLRENGGNATAEAFMASDAAGFNDLSWQRELHKLRKGFDSGQYSQFVGGPLGWSAKRAPILGRKKTPEFERFRALECTYKDWQKKKATVDKIVVHDEEIRQMDLALTLDEDLDNVERLSRLCMLDRSIAQYREILDKEPKKRLSRVHYIADNRAAWKRDLPLLLWDRRHAEPIICRVNEFQSTRTLALVDFEPNVNSLPPLTHAQELYLETMRRSIFANPVLSVTTALNSMALGAAEALIPQAPSLQDPRRGGRRDVDQLRIRLLTPEMIRELAVALEQWKDKPTLHALFGV